MKPDMPINQWVKERYNLNFDDLFEDDKARFRRYFANPDIDTALDSYTVEMDVEDERAPTYCGDCGWKGRVNQTSSIEDCWLTPGHPSPVGRCPACQSLVYSTP